MFTIIVPYYLYAFFVYVLQLISPHFARRSHERDTPAIIPTVAISTAQCYPHSCNIKTKFDKIKLQITIIYNLLCSIRSILARCKTNLFSPVEPNSFSRREIKQVLWLRSLRRKYFLFSFVHAESNSGEQQHGRCSWASQWKSLKVFEE